MERNDNISQIVLIGSLDAPDAHAVDVQFQGATAARNRPAIVDLTHLDFIASLGIEMLLGGAKSLMRKGHRLVLLNPQELVEKVLRTVGVHEAMPIAKSMDEALELLSATE